ncbi:MAG: cobalamin B12-binding domain-containing protein [Planctomycetes bacterium]|nr:cobalamin B12-binding domain-containing protein [Planctomycetota bacterium]
MTEARPIRVLVAKPGLDGHDRGARVVASALRDAGMEVIYGGLWLSPEEIVTIAEQEDVDVIGLSSMNNAHMTVFPRTLELLRERGLGDVLLTGGGIMTAEDMEALGRMGVGRLFGPGSDMDAFVEYIRRWCETRARGTEGRGTCPTA